jgi:hypothetical protein
MLKPNVTSPSTNNNFDLKLTHVDSVTVASNTYTQVFEATGHFEQPENLRGYCGAGGFCSWDLLPEQVPYPVYQNRTFCQGSCP